MMMIIIIIAGGKIIIIIIIPSREKNDPLSILRNAGSEEIAMSEGRRAGPGI